MSLIQVHHITGATGKINGRTQAGQLASKATRSAHPFIAVVRSEIAALQEFSSLAFLPFRISIPYPQLADLFAPCAHIFASVTEHLLKLALIKKREREIFPVVR